MMEMYVSKAMRHWPMDRGSRLVGTTLIVVPPDVSSSTVHCCSADALKSSCISMYTPSQIFALILGSTMSPSRSPSGEVTKFSCSPGAALATDRLTACCTVDVWLASVVSRSGGSTTGVATDGLAGCVGTKESADASGGGDEMVDAGPVGGLRGACCCKTNKSLETLCRAPVSADICCDSSS
jgi:hypothetical protein